MVREVRGQSELNQAIGASQPQNQRWDGQPDIFGVHGFMAHADLHTNFMCRHSQIHVFHDKQPIIKLIQKFQISNSR
jgi:hypothetical protein